MFDQCPAYDKPGQILDRRDDLRIVADIFVIAAIIAALMLPPFRHFLHQKDADTAHNKYIRVYSLN